MRSPLLFLVFNRPDTTRQVFEAIRAAQPPRLYVAADGPRGGRSGEEERCQQVRSIATAVDWPCEVRTLFRDENRGCKLGVSEGISWFFENEEEGIILEDDVLPMPSFFPYCDELLERYRRNENVAMISGCNLVASRYASQTSYFFSRNTHIWGWASWRRAWKHYDVAMKSWPGWHQQGGLTRLFKGNRAAAYCWRETFDAVHAGKIDTWDYQWHYTCWERGSVNILPANNLTHNLGFGPDATHTSAATPAYVIESNPKDMEFPLKHPESLEPASAADSLINTHIYGITARSAWKRWLRSLPVLGKVLSAINKHMKNV